MHYNISRITISYTLLLYKYNNYNKGIKLEFLTKFLAVLAGASSTTVVVGAAIIIVILVVVYFKYIKPTFIIFVKNQNKIEETSKDIHEIKEATNKLQNEDSTAIHGLLRENNDHLVDISITLSDLRDLMKEISIDIHDHDKGHTEKLTDMLIEMNKLSIRLEASMIQTRGVK